MSEESFIERRICVGLIVSTEYVQRISSVLDVSLLETQAAKTLATWVLDYYGKYNRAPNKDIQGIYEEKRQFLAKDDSESIAHVLESLSEEYEREQFNVDYLLDQTREYVQLRHLAEHAEQIQSRLEQGEVKDAEAVAATYIPIKSSENPSYIDPFSTSASAAVLSAFGSRSAPLIHFSKALGEFWNAEMVRDGFVAFMGREKIGKTFLLIDLAIRAIRSGCNTVFFQAGDMTEGQQLRRLSIYLAQRSDQERYCSDVWVPQVDCKHNQTDSCDRPQREAVQEAIHVTGDWEYEDLDKAARQFPNHVTCRNCSHIAGAPWLKKKQDATPLTPDEAVKIMASFSRRAKGQLRLSTHTNESLTVSHMKALLNSWERQEAFVPDVIIVDYADLLAPCPDIGRQDFRQQQNKIWQRLRALSQERHCLLVTATQAKATAYKKDLLDLSDYSEDKRKYAHVTAMYGLNQTFEEKRIGVMRVNPLLIRDGDFSADRPITILQRLQIGRPVLGSYW